MHSASHPARDLARSLERRRAALGLTQQQVAARAGISRVAYRSLETGAATPRARTLEALAKALRVPLAELLRPEPELKQVRFRSEGQELRSRRTVLAEVAVRLRAYAELEDLLGVRRPVKLPRGGGRGGDVGARDAAAVVRRGFGLAEGAVIRDLCGLLEASGVKVLTVGVRAPGFFGLSVAGGTGAPAVVVNTHPRITVERWVFTAAHELGHLVLHRDDYAVDEAEEDVRHERAAHVFASHFLMPDSVFTGEWRDAAGLPIVQRVLKVKSMFRVSWRTVLHRAAEHDGPETWAAFLRAYEREHHRKLGRLDEPLPLSPRAFAGVPAEHRPSHEPDSMPPGVFVHDRLHLLVRHAIELDAITLSRGAEILGVTLTNMRALAAAWTRR